MTRREKRKFKKRKKREERIRQAKHRGKSGKSVKPWWASNSTPNHRRQNRRKRSGVLDWLNLRPDQQLKYRKKI